MILSELNTILVNTAKSHYLVNEAFVGDVYTINSKENRFGCFVATPMTAVKLGTGTIRYRYVLYYIDRLTKAEDNIDFVQSDGVNVLKGILNFLDSNGGQIEEGYEFTLFRQKFSDWCAGAYVSVSIVVPDDDCGEYFNMSGNDLRPLNVDKNGIYEPGTFDGYNKVTINVPQVGATEEWVDDEIDLKLSSALTPYATFSYVDDQISGVRAELPNLEPYATKNWVNVQGYLSSCDLDPYATKVWVGAQDYLSSCDLEPYATRIWVENQGYVTTSLFSTTLSSYATRSWVSNNYVSNSFFTTTLSSYATRSWVSNNYVSNSFFTTTLSSYATKSWVSNTIVNVMDGKIATSSVLGTVKVGPGLEITSSGVLSPRVGDGVDTLLMINEGGYLCLDYSYYMQFTKSMIEEYGYATESWVSSNFLTASAMSDYVLKTYNSGGVRMEFGDSNPYMYMSSQSTHLTVRPNNIYMYHSSNATLINTTGITNQMGSSRAGIWYDNTLSSVVLGVEDNQNTLKIDTQNIYMSDGLTTTTLSISDIATRTWVSSNYFEESKIWTGTTSQWNDLTSEQKAFYTIALITE